MNPILRDAQTLKFNLTLPTPEFHPSIPRGAHQGMLNQPATSPATTYLELNISSASLPRSFQRVKVANSNAVCVIDVLQALAQHVGVPMTRDEFGVLAQQAGSAAAEVAVRAFNVRARDTVTHRAGMMRFDCLGERTCFAGMRFDERLGVFEVGLL